MSGVNQICREASKELKGQWMKRVKREFQNGPLASNVVFGLILTVLERLVETEFECPCKGKCANGWFVAAFFIFPGILASVLMASVQGLKCSCDIDNAKRFFHCLVPAFVWMILLVFDGRYIACALTDWSGRYVTDDKAAPLKWCQPENGTSYQNILKESQDWYFHSQWAGLGLVLGLALVFLVYLIIKCIMNKSPDKKQSSLKCPSPDPERSTCTSAGEGDNRIAILKVKSGFQKRKMKLSRYSSPDTNPTDK